MNRATAVPAFEPGAPDAAGIVSWVHIGDLHMTEAGRQNDLDLQAIADEINRAFADSIAFIFLPGDVADQGSAAQYAVVRAALDRLQAPWCSIVGDHDVHEKSFENYLAAMAQTTRYAFNAGSLRFVAMNAFDVPDPRSFTMLPDQLDWVEGEIAQAKQQGRKVVLLLHCYPSDLKQGSERLQELVRDPAVLLVDMGHTHYNEVANDGRTLYTATRSTGQIEEGPVGFSVTNIDGGIVSWKFFRLGELPAAMITSPSDERLIVEAGAPGAIEDETIRVRVKVWSDAQISSVEASCEGQVVQLTQVAGSRVWQGELSRSRLRDGVNELAAKAWDANGKLAEDRIRMVVGTSALQPVQRAKRDQDNAIGAWPERGLLGTQLGPNKNGRKW